MILLLSLVLSISKVDFKAYFLFDIVSILYQESNHNTNGAEFFFVNFYIIYLSVSYVPL